MATYTTNYNLEKPEATDPFGDFRQSYNDNMDIIDANLGGGGGGGGHTIVDENGSDMPAESKLQFTGNVSVSDDNVNGATVVDILGGGGGANYGFAIDENNKLFEGTINDFNQSLSYTATEDAIALCWYKGSVGTWQFLSVNGTFIRLGGNGTDQPVSYAIPIRKGDTVASRYQSGSESCYFWLSVYGIKQGTNGIFAPVIYSDNERKIGIWRDNKPLYAKTVSFTTGNSNTYLNYLTDIANPETMLVDYRGSFYSTGTSKVGATPYFGQLDDTKDTNAFAVLCNAVGGFLRIDYRVGTSAYNKTAFVTLYYTKTTDVAGSGNWNTDGVPTVHYDGNEQVIGTWFGKPLYQKTWDFGSNLIVSYNSWTNTIINKSDNSIKSVIKAVGHNNTLGACWNSVDVSVEVSPYVALLCNRNNNSTIGIQYLTLQYTKTTD